MFYGIWLVVLGALAVPSLILRKPEMKSVLETITPYQGWIGAVSAFWGLWGIISSVLNLGLLGSFPIWWITLAGTSVVTFALGMLLGVGTLKTFIKSDTAQQKMDEINAKLRPYQGNLGIAALGLGAWCIVASLILT
ncbi:MAG: hypothetical protein AAF219_06415 [Myxococcota bacterium]